jgi:hypothetical protein
VILYLQGKRKMNNTIKHLPNGDFEVVYDTPLGKAEEFHSDKGYKESTLEKCEEFAKQRNYHYTNTNNPIDFPKD